MAGGTRLAGSEGKRATRRPVGLRRPKVGQRERAELAIRVDQREGSHDAFLLERAGGHAELGVLLVPAGVLVCTWLRLGDGSSSHGLLRISGDEGGGDRSRADGDDEAHDEDVRREARHWCLLLTSPAGRRRITRRAGQTSKPTRAARAIAPQTAFRTAGW